jgi:hypothetical protein
MIEADKQRVGEPFEEQNFQKSHKGDAKIATVTWGDAFGEG